jgi:hypothetical protein
MTTRQPQLQRLQLLRCLNKTNRQPGLHMPLDMAMEQRNPWIIRPESNRRISAPVNHHCVSSHWDRRVRGHDAREVVGVAGAIDDLEIVPVEMEGVVVVVVVGDGELDDVSVGEEVGVRACAVDGGVIY